MKWRGKKKTQTVLTHLFFLSVLPHASIFFSFCFVLKAPPLTLLLLRNHIPLSYNHSMMNFTWYWKLANPEIAVEKSNNHLATADFAFRWSDDRKSYQHLTMSHCERAFTCRHTGQHTHISPTFIWWTASNAGFKVPWNGKHSHL